VLSDYNMASAKQLYLQSTRRHQVSGWLSYYSNKWQHRNEENI
jgi:hypothetical protein